MTIPCCVPPTGGGEPWTCFDALDAAQCELFGGDVGATIPRSGPAGFECSSEGGCWRCEPDDPFEFVQWCCLPEPILGAYEAFPSVCEACGGRPVFNQIECEEPPPPPPPAGCRRAGEDRLPVGGKRWTLDLSGTVALGLDPAPDPSGYAQSLSATLTRAVDTPNSDPEDPCGHIRGGNVMLDDGYVYTELCSKPIHNEFESRRRTYAVLRTAEGTPRLHDGYQYAVGAVRLPYWTEVMYRSAEWRCRGPEE